MQLRRTVKRGLATFASPHAARGLTMLIYHRVGEGTADERGVGRGDFEAQLAVLEDHDVVALDAALDRLDAGDTRPTVVITFDDGFADVRHGAYPALLDRGMPFTLYLATRYMGGRMAWPGSTARDDGPALSWDEVGEMVGSGLCTVGNHTHTHVSPERIDEAELDACSDAVATHVGVRPVHFAYPWGRPAPQARAALAARFRSAATGRPGRNEPATDRLLLDRVPVRGSDPLSFFRAKLSGDLGPERAYDGLVRTVKRARASG